MTRKKKKKKSTSNTHPSSPVEKEIQIRATYKDRQHVERINLQAALPLQESINNTARLPSTTLPQHNNYDAYIKKDKQPNNKNSAVVHALHTFQSNEIIIMQSEGRPFRRVELVTTAGTQAVFGPRLFEVCPNRQVEI